MSDAVMQGELVQVVKHIVDRAAETKVLRFRHCARFLPCTHICKPEMEEISKAAAAAVASALDCCTLLLSLCVLNGVFECCCWLKLKAVAMSPPGSTFTGCAFNVLDGQKLPKNELLCNDLVGTRLPIEPK